MIVDMPLTEPVFVPEGATVVSVDPLRVDLPDYDYEPFAVPAAPAFDFIADRLHPDGRIDRAVPCTSLPGRTTIERT